MTHTERERHGFGRHTIRIKRQTQKSPASEIAGRAFVLSVAWD
jgi:hypothetical protein